MRSAAPEVSLSDLISQSSNDIVTFSLPERRYEKFSAAGPDIPRLVMTAVSLISFLSFLIVMGIVMENIQEMVG